MKIQTKNNKNLTFYLNTRFKEKILNTFFQIHSLWSYIFSNNNPSNLKSNINLLDRIIYKLFWFWPRNYEAAEWYNSKIGSLKDANQFTNYNNDQEDVDILIEKIVRYNQKKEVRILDLGCNVGRISQLLLNKGYNNLYGVDISIQSHDLMKKFYPELYRTMKFERNLFQNYLSNCEDNYFETVFSMGATLEMVHPSYPLIKNMCRITKDNIIINIKDSSHSYPRFWEYEFNKYGFYLKELFRNDSSTFVFVKG